MSDDRTTDDTDSGEVRPPGLSAVQKAVGDIAPKLAQLTEDVLFDDVWQRGDLGTRERSLVTVAALIALGRTEQLAFHLDRAIDNDVTPAELVEVITHLAFYSGWPTAMSAAGELRKVLRHGL